MNLGRAIKLCRSQFQMSQDELARKADISVSYLSLIEQGKRDPAFSTVTRLSAALGVPLSILAFLASDKNELSDINPDLAQRLSLTALTFLNESHKNQQDKQQTLL